MKTTKAYFDRFKEEFLRWQKLLGLTQYRIDFFHEPLDGSYAEIRVSEAGKTARVSCATSISKDSHKNDRGPEAHARHEVCHLLTNRLRWLGESRYIECSDLEEEWEAIAVRLDKVLK